jgi:peptide/nickel transport system substrate-binding protein
MSVTRRHFAISGLAPALPWLGVAPAAWAQDKQRAVTVSLSLEPDSLDPTTSASASIGEVVHYNVWKG